MHLWPLETDPRTPTARVQTAPIPAQRTTETHQTTPPDLADGDAYGGRTQGDNWVPDGNWSGYKDMGLGPENGG